MRCLSNLSNVRQFLQSVLFFLILSSTFLGPAVAVNAQVSGISDNGPTISVDENPEGAIARLSDSEVRRLLLERVTKEETKPETPFNPAIVAWRLQQSFGVLHKKASAIVASAPELPTVFPRAYKILSADRGTGDVSQFLLIFLGSLALGGVVEFILRQKLKPQVAVIADKSSTNMVERAKALGFLFVLDSIAVLAFLVITTIAYFALAQGDGWFRTTFVFYMSAVTMIRFVMIGADAFLGRRHSTQRIPLFTDREAGLLYWAVLATVIMGAFGFFTCALFAVLGIGGDVHLLLLIMVGTFTTAGLVVTAICGRHALARDLVIDIENDHRIGSFVAKAWPWSFAVIIAVIWVGVVVSALLDHTPLYGAALFSIGLLFVTPSALAALEREARNRIDADEEAWAAVLRAGRISLAILAMISLAVVWRLDVTGMAGNGLSGQVSNALFQVAVTLLLTYVCWQTARIWIDKKITEEDRAFADLGVDVSEMEIGGTGLSRVRTLLPLLKRSIQITITVIAFIIVLSALGVDIGPVLAGAGVVGLAIGFGSQALVRDIVSGVFFLLDDAFRLGEYVNVGAVKGSVEKISIRSFQLRHHLGAVNTVPFGEINTISNYSRDWAIMKLPFRISFGTDIEKVRKVIKKVGQELLEHPDVGEDFIQPFKSQGVLEIDDYGLIVRAKFMCKPGRQFLIRRYAFIGVQQAFADNDIEFARPEIKVRTDGDDDASEEAAVTDKKTSDASAAAYSTLMGKVEPEPNHKP